LGKQRPHRFVIRAHYIFDYPSFNLEVSQSFPSKSRKTIYSRVKLFAVI
jgi:hypothetical protein